jgi:VanZ family protein
MPMPTLFLRLLPVILWMALIFIGSSILKPEGEPGLGPWDKLAHMIAYGGLAWLIACALFPDSAVGWKQISLVVLLATLYGVSDEFHQSFVPGREASLGDLAADASGALLAACLLYWLRSRRVMVSQGGAP